MVVKGWNISIPYMNPFIIAHCEKTVMGKLKEHCYRVEVNSVRSQLSYTPSKEDTKKLKFKKR